MTSQIHFRFAVSHVNMSRVVDWIRFLHGWLPGLPILVVFSFLILGNTHV